MATSESDDFESADEGFDAEDSPKKNKPLGVTTNEQKLPPGPAKEIKGPVFVEESSNDLPEEESGWEPEDLDDYILDSIGEETIKEVTKAAEELNVDLVEKTPITEAPSENLENLSEALTFKTDQTEAPKDVQQTECRQKPIREAKNVGKLGSGGPKKLGNKLSGGVAPAKVPEDSFDKIEKSNTEPESKEETEEQKPVEVKSVFDKLATVEEPQQPSLGWGSWGGWGTSLLTSATSSVTSLGSQVIHSVIDTVESGLGAPNPEEIAREQIESVKEPLAELNEEEDTAEGIDQPNRSFPLGNWISGVSQLGKIVESTGSKVISGGLDTLENIGKKTMQVLQDGDPGLKKKRALFQPDKPVLSQALREAKELAEQHEQAAEEKVAARRVHFETLFDDFQGLVHLEALEMLSRQCEMKLQSSLLKLAGAELKEAHEMLVAVRDESILPSTDDIEEPEGDIVEVVKNNIQSLPVNISSDKLLKIWDGLQSLSTQDATLADDHAHCISSLAELTSACVEIFHRTGELLTVNENRDPLAEAQSLQKLTVNMTFLVEKSATLLCEHLNQKHGEDAQMIITKVFLEASNSSTYIQDAFQLLMPVLQQATLH